MDVQELEKLSVWYVERISELAPLFQQLISQIQTSVNQGTKQPIEEYTNALIAHLSQLRFDQLSLTQLKLLSELEVAAFLGPDGANFIESTIKTADYDPTTALARLNNAFSILSQISSKFAVFLDSIDSLKLRQNNNPEDTKSITIRVGFQNEASIDNLVDWKDSAKDWHDIIRGLSLASDEAPEDTKIIGASTGSIILILAGTLSVTTLLALISGRLTAVAMHVIGIGNQIEDLRHKKYLNKIIEKQLVDQQNDAKRAALTDIMDILAKKLPNIDGEKTNALEESVKKLLIFNEKGGVLDFVSPNLDDQITDEAVEGDDGAPDTSVKLALSEARDAINASQEVREKLKLLADQRAPS